MNKHSPAIVLVACCAGMAASAHAGGVNDVGVSVRSALALQRSGQAAAPVRPMLEDAAERSYVRYLDSFTYPIPEQFDRDETFAADAGN